VLKEYGIWSKQNLVGWVGVPVGEFVKTVMRTWVSVNEGNLLTKLTRSR